MLNPWTLSTMVNFSHSRYFPLYFWWFIFNFGCIPRTSCCVRIVLYFVVLTLYEMECVEPLNPTVRWLLSAISKMFFFISDDSSLILVAYLVHWVLRRDIRSRRSSINCASAKELSTVRYLLPGLPEFVASVLLLLVGLWVRPEVWSYNQFAGDCKFKYE